MVNKGLPIEEVDRKWEDANPRTSRPNPRTLSAWLPPAANRQTLEKRSWNQERFLVSTTQSPVKPIINDNGFSWYKSRGKCSHSAQTTSDSGTNVEIKSISYQAFGYPIYHLIYSNIYLDNPQQTAVAFGRLLDSSIGTDCNLPTLHPQCRTSETFSATSFLPRRIAPLLEKGHLPPPARLVNSSQLHTRYGRCSNDVGKYIQPLCQMRYPPFRMGKVYHNIHA